MQQWVSTEVHAFEALSEDPECRMTFQAHKQSRLAELQNPRETEPSKASRKLERCT